MQPDEQPVEIRDLYESLFREKEYTQYEMDSIIPGYDYEDMDSDPICIAIDLKNERNKSEAIDILLKLLEKDFRCIDAYSHLGNFHMPDDENSPFIDFAIDYYKAGVEMGEFFLGENFEGQLPLGMIDNRPFLRSLHGYGLCLMRSGKKEEALAVFKRILKFSPMDNLEVRFLITNVN